MSQPFQPVTDPALLEQLLQELLSSCEEELTEESESAAKQDAAARQEQASRAGAARWQQVSGQPTTVTPPLSKPAGGRSLLDVRLPPKKK